MSNNSVKSATDMLAEKQQTTNEEALGKMKEAMGAKGELKLLVKPTARICATGGVVERMQNEPEFKEFVSECIKRHFTCDWGDISEEDKERQDVLAHTNAEVHSCYIWNPETHDGDIMIDTNADRDMTIVQYPSEYKEEDKK